MQGNTNFSQDITYADKHLLITVPDGSVQIAERIDPMPKVNKSIISNNPLCLYSHV